MTAAHENATDFSDLLGVDPRRAALEGFDFPFGGADAPRQIVSGEFPENAGAPKPAADVDVHRI